VTGPVPEEDEENPEPEIEFSGNTPLPQFDPALPAVIQIQKTASPLPWKLKLPPTVDPNEDGDLQMNVNLGPASVFVKFSIAENSFLIPDLSSAAVLEGTYENLEVTLSDLEGSQTFEFEIHVLPYVEGADEEEAQEGSTTQLSEDDMKEIADQLTKANAETSVESETQSVVPEEPSFKIDEVKPFSEAVLEFSMSMKFPSNMLDLINEQQKEVWERSKLNETATDDDDVDKILELSIVPGED